MQKNDLKKSLHLRSLKMTELSKGDAEIAGLAKKDTEEKC